MKMSIFYYFSLINRIYDSLKKYEKKKYNKKKPKRFYDRKKYKNNKYSNITNIKKLFE
jgi:hypothetical protein